MPPTDQPNSSQEIVFMAPDSILENQGQVPVFQLEDAVVAPNPAVNTSADTTLTQPFRIDGEKVFYGDKEFDMSSFTAIVDAGINPSEANRAATQKFTEAAEIRSQIEAERANHQALIAVAESLYALPEAAQEEMFRYASELQQSVASGNYAGGQLQSNSLPEVALPFKVPDGYKPDAQLKDFDSLSDESQAVAAAFMPVISQLMQQQAHLARQVQQIGKVVPEMSQYVQDTKMTQAQNAAAATIKSEFNREVTAAELTEAVKATKIENPHLAWVIHNRTSLATPAAPAVIKAPDSPNSTPDHFDSKGMSADEIARNLQAGKKLAK